MTNIIKRGALIKIHYNCNNDCLFCHSHNRKINNKKEFDFEKLSKKITLAKSLGVDCVVFSGGEPTINENIFLALKEVKKNKMNSGFVSNGRSFSDKSFLDNAISLNSIYFYISLHSHKKSIHETITRSSNSWVEAVQGISNIVDCNKELTVNCVVLKDNVEELIDFSKFLIDIGVENIKFTYPFIEGSMKKNTNHMININYAGEKISEAIGFCRKNNVNGYYEGLPYCLINKEFRNLVNDLKSNNIFFVSEFFKDDFKEEILTNYKKEKQCNNCLYNFLCLGYHMDHETIINSIN